MYGEKKSISLNLKDAANGQQIYLAQLIYRHARALGFKKYLPLQTLQHHTVLLFSELQKKTY